MKIETIFVRLGIATMYKQDIMRQVALLTVPDVVVKLNALIEIHIVLLEPSILFLLDTTLCQVLGRMT